jgi:ribosomal protein L10
MPKDVKVKEVEALTAKAKDASALYFVDFTGVTAIDITALRRQLREQKVGMRVVKNRLAGRALSQAGVKTEVEAILKGPTSIVFAAADPLAPARLLRDATGRLKALKVKGAWFDGAVYPADRFEFLASLPSRQDLRAELVGVLQDPLGELVFVLDGLLPELVRVLEGVGEKKASAPVEASQPAEQGIAAST